MSVTAVTPRVRIMAICDEVIPSELEDGVFTLEGVRQHRYATCLPFATELSLFLTLSSARKGSYPGKICVVSDRTGKAIRYMRFKAEFEDDNDWTPLHLQLDLCSFPEAGRYTFEVWFADRKGNEAQKGEQPFDVFSNED